ncbi:acyl-CoA carboxylase subunit beta [Rhodococcoides yunnanense]|uniref:acyl-CoA carboxylase subunit beta n=1 Tax=Rhodococcoides yunnanense TaxID=278209 RepID=UPI00093526C5|nr:carboxyl transferase domain-containing protein [Rhodococcus yunnanensis]
MSQLVSRLDVRSDEFERNRKAMLTALESIEGHTAKVVAGGGERYVERHRARGKLLVRERVELLIDRDSALLELSPLAGAETDDPIGGGVVTAVGVVSGVECVIIANDATVRGGAQSPSTVRKINRALEVATVNRLPLITLVESGGADLPNQSKIFVTGGSSFKDISRLSKAGIPTISLVFGSSTAGGAYMPGMSDYTVLVKEQAQVFLGGPPLVKMATNEDADVEELGGAEMHARVSGLADYLAADERDALRIGREIMAHLRGVRPPSTLTGGSEPVYPVDELLGIPSADPRQPYDIREIIARTVDGSDLAEFKPIYGANLVCGWATLHGQSIGVLGNNGILFSEEAQKGSQFIQLCNQTGTPLLFIHNITGFMVGTRYEQGGIIKDGAKLINAVSNSVVPHLVLMVGSSYGAGNYAMSGRAYDPRFVFTWPSHRIAVMGGKQLAGVMSIIRKNAAEAAGRTFDLDDDAARRQTIEDQIDRESTALYSTGQVWDDGIIDPRDTRVVLGLALSAAMGRPSSGARGFANFRM